MTYDGGHLSICLYVQGQCGSGAEDWVTKGFGDAGILSVAWAVVCPSVARAEHFWYCHGGTTAA